jgi:hypothetical protein
MHRHFVTRSQLQDKEDDTLGSGCLLRNVIACACLHLSIAMNRMSSFTQRIPHGSKLLP